MPTTSTFALPYPTDSSEVDVPGDLQALAEGVEVALGSASITTKTGSYVLTASDAGRMVEMNVGSANTLTVPPDLPAGTQVLIVQIGAGQTTLVEGSGVTIRRRFGLKIAGQNGAVLLYARTSTDWVAVGATSS